ncbi:MAG TPA: FtsX-like permease family protein [Bacillota bacterium]|nr:FtsX-like permease family protein [Bacillota bacterium]
MLWRKMFRDLLENRMAYLACTIVIAIGLMVYTSMSMAKANLFMAKDQFYHTYHFADAFAKMKAIPATKTTSLGKLDGVATVTGRLVEDVRVLMPGSTENVTLRMTSLFNTKDNELNRVKLIRGTFPEKGKREILLADKFYTANHLQIGQKLQVLIDGKQVELTISGSGQSPEYVYAMKEAQNITPDPLKFELAYLPYEDMEKLFDQRGLVNDLSFSLKPGVKFEDVEHEWRAELAPYELESLYASKDQLSNRMLTEKLNQLDKMSRSLPLLFLSIAAIIQYIMLKRLVESQRGLIGTLKAFGYGKWEIVAHYLSYGLIIGVLGGILGGLLGTALSMYITTIYQQFYSLPDLRAHFSLNYFLLGMFMAALFSLAASLQGARGVLKLQPAEAMRPSVPVFLKKNRFENIPGLWMMFTMQGRMALRNLGRSKARSFFTFIGILFTFSMMASFFSLSKMADIMIMDQFTKEQGQDMKLSFSKPLPLDEIVAELQHGRGVRQVQPMVEVPTTLRFLNHKKDVAAIGVAKDSTLYHIYDQDDQVVEVPKSGMMLSTQVADTLHVQVGDVVQMESIWTKDTKMNVRIEKIVPQYIGANVYMNQDALLNMLKQGRMVTSVLIAMDKKDIPELKEQYRTSKFVSDVEIREDMINQYKQLMGASSSSLWIMAVMAVITGFAIVYNSSMISLSERKRELASLRVLGLTSSEVVEIISIEQWMLGLAGMIAGIPLSIAMNQGIAKSMSSDLFTMTAVTSPDAIVQAFVGTMLAIWISQLGISRKVKRLDLVEVLKERD